MIFDCDGVLVDTERLSIRIDTEVLADLGIPMTQQEVIDRFVGRTEDYWQSEVRRLLGRDVSAEEFAAYDPWYRAAFEADLTAIDGIAEAIDALDERRIQTCVASSGSHERMEFTLGHTGLYPRFAGRIFSATEVAEGKPSPLLFLHAAEQMSVAPARCLVIEDSRYGVQAARGARHAGRGLLRLGHLGRGAARGRCQHRHRRHAQDPRAARHPLSPAAGLVAQVSDNFATPRPQAHIARSEMWGLNPASRHERTVRWKTTVRWTPQTRHQPGSPTADDDAGPPQRA